MKRIAVLKCIRKTQRKRRHKKSEQEEETIFPKRRAPRKIFTLNEELDSILFAIRGERVEHGNELRCHDCKKCMMTKACQDKTRTIFQIPKVTILAVIRPSMKTLQTTA